MTNTINSVSFVLALIASSINGCAAVNTGLRPPEALPSLSFLDNEIIIDMTEKYKGSGVNGFEGISGRVLELVLLALTEMSSNHSERCKPDPLNNHLFFYKEKDDVIYIQTAPRFVPDDRPPPPPPPPGYRSLTTKELFPSLPAGAYGLEGCEIRFEIDVNKKKIINTQIIR